MINRKWFNQIVSLSVINVLRANNCDLSFIIQVLNNISIFIQIHENTDEQGQKNDERMTFHELMDNSLNKVTEMKISRDLYNEQRQKINQIFSHIYGSLRSMLSNNVVREQAKKIIGEKPDGKIKDELLVEITDGKVHSDALKNILHDIQISEQSAFSRAIQMLGPRPRAPKLKDVVTGILGNSAGTQTLYDGMGSRQDTVLVSITLSLPGGKSIETPCSLNSKKKGTLARYVRKVNDRGDPTCSR
jgi:hypothetical protein